MTPTPLPPLGRYSGRIFWWDLAHMAVRGCAVLGADGLRASCGSIQI